VELHRPAAFGEQRGAGRQHVLDVDHADALGVGRLDQPAGVLQGAGAVRDHHAAAREVLVLEIDDDDRRRVGPQGVDRRGAGHLADGGMGRPGGGDRGDGGHAKQAGKTESSNVHAGDTWVVE
jgi:hypothetical protein